MAEKTIIICDDCDEESDKLFTCKCKKVLCPDCAREHLEQEHLDDMVDDEFDYYFTELEQE